MLIVGIGILNIGTKIFRMKMAKADKKHRLPFLLLGYLIILQSLTTVMGEYPSRCGAKTNHSSSTTATDIASTIPPANMTPVTANLAFISSIKGGEAKFFGGAFFLAVDDLNSYAQREGIPANFTWSFHETQNKEANALRVMADLFCEKSVSAFIGPDAFCRSSGLAATALEIPYMAFKCGDGHNETNWLMVNTKTFFGFSARYVVGVMRHYGWTSAWLVTGKEYKWRTTARVLMEQMRDEDITLNGETIDDLNDKFSPFHLFRSATGYRKIVQNSKDRTRVYIFLGVFDSLKLFVREIANLKERASEYVVIAADDSGKNLTHADFFLLSSERPPEFTESDRSASLNAFQNVLVVRASMKEGSDQAFEDRVYRRDMQPPMNLPGPPPSLSLSRPTIPQTAYSLYDATYMYGQAVMALMAIPGADPLSGKDIMHWLRCRLHDSIKGSQVYIHKDGYSEETFIVESLAFKDNVVQERLWNVGTFSQENDSVIFRPAHNKITWREGKIPVSNPECGFVGHLCGGEEGTKTGMWIGIVLPLIILVILLVIAVLWLRHYHKERKLESLLWKIESDEIKHINSEQLKEMTTPARPRRKISDNHLQSFVLAQSQEPDVICGGNQDVKAFMYKGNRVFVKMLACKHVELSRPLMKQLHLRKEMTHENINRFIGACIDPTNVCIVSQYCSRRSLQDILENDDSPTDNMFTTSIVQDLITGMAYIHDSEFGCHGNLKSSNCLVDSRWTVKIADFGLDFLKPTHSRLDDDGTSYRDLLWCAPELLQYRVAPNSSTSSSSSRNNSNSDPNLLMTSQPHWSLLNYNSSCNHSGVGGGGGVGAGVGGSSTRAGNIKRNLFELICSQSGRRGKMAATGTQKGDVYSFAIILYELYGHGGPWGNTQMSSPDIVYSLMNQRPPTPRPDVKQLNTCDNAMVSLIESCWVDNPDQRPDFKGGIRDKFQPIQKSLLSSNIIDNMLAKMEKYTDNLEEVVAKRTKELRREKMMTDNLLLRMLPRSVAEKLKRGEPVPPEQFEQVTIYFSDIVGFTEMSADSTPMEVVDLLNNLYTCFDSIIEMFDVYKVETIGDAYMVVSGLPIKNGDRHAGEIASMALQLLDKIKKKRFRIRGRDNNTLKIRIGIHSGPCCAGVVGLKMPRYCLFGDTINTANRLESTGEALKIHCSEDCKKILDKLGGYHLEERGYTAMKGKGKLLTYFLLSEDHRQRQRRISLIQKTGTPGRCVSASNIDYSGRLYYAGSPANNLNFGSNLTLGRSRQGFSSGNLVSYPPASASSSANVNGAVAGSRISLPAMVPRINLGMPFQDRQIVNSNLNMSVDSSWSDLSQGDRASYPSQSNQYNPFNQPNSQLQQPEEDVRSPSCPVTPNSGSAFAKEFQFLPCTLPRTHGHRAAGSFMSPIAEDPLNLTPLTHESPGGGRGVVRYSVDSGAGSEMFDNTVSTLRSDSSTSPRSRIASEPTASESDTDEPNSSATTFTTVFSRNSFDLDRCASEPPELVSHRTNTSGDQYSLLNHVHAERSQPVQQCEAVPSESGSPFSAETIPSETDSLLESSAASSSNPFTRQDDIDIPDESLLNTDNHISVPLDQNPLFSDDPMGNTADAVLFSAERNSKKDQIIGGERNSPGNLGETIL